MPLNKNNPAIGGDLRALAPALGLGALGAGGVYLASRDEDRR